MMNFFYDQGSSKGTNTSRPFCHSSSSSSSSSSSQKILVPFSYNQQQQQQRSWLSSNNTTNNINYNGAEEGTPPTANDNSQLDLGVLGPSSSSANNSMVEKEHMFDKVVTPSDVGKLNRLVIPKQHAEKYFPLDSSTNEKGLLLNFEDRNGKPWRFRYSYWNSSQSYVMTKGWSRFVKDKKLDAGDIVSFQRGVGESAKDRLFIDWRRRPDAPTHHHHTIQYPPAFNWNHSLFLQPYPPHTYSAYGNHVGNSPNYYHTSTSSSSNYYVNDNATTHHVVNGNPYPSRSLVYLRSGAAAQAPQVVQMQRGSISSGTFAEPMVFDSVPVVQGKAAAKRFRLFGVNMDCPIPDSEQVCAMLSSSRSLPTPAPSTAATYSHAPQFLSPPSSASSSIPEYRTLINYHNNPAAAQEQEEELSDKGKASMSLDLEM